MFTHITSFFTIIANILIGFVLSIFFVYIPTFFFDPHAIIPLVEHDLKITIPDEYMISHKHEDHFGFELHQEIHFTFHDKDIQTIINDIEGYPNIWEKTSKGYTLYTKDQDEGIVSITEAEFIPKEHMLLYTYREF